LIIAGPGGPGSLLQADGSGNDTLLADNNGLNVFRILSSDTGANLMIGGNLTNVFADSGFGDDTLVGGVGLNTLLAGSGSDSLYASDPAAWVQATSAAANDGISLIPPTVFEGDALATAINALLNDPQPLSMTNEATLQSDLVEENQALFAQQTVVENELIAITNSLSSGTVAANKNVLTGLPSTAGLLPGDGVVGNNLPAGTAITAILSNTSVQLSAVAIGSQANEPLTIVTTNCNICLRSSWSSPPTWRPKERRCKRIPCLAAPERTCSTAIPASPPTWPAAPTTIRSIATKAPTQFQAVVASTR
jgi:hypothetical protein